MNSTVDYTIPSTIDSSVQGEFYLDYFPDYVAESQDPYFYGFSHNSSITPHYASQEHMIQPQETVLPSDILNPPRPLLNQVNDWRETKETGGITMDEAGNDPTNVARAQDAFVCVKSGCEHVLPFHRRSDFDRHMAKHTRPYTCSEGCDKSFADKAGLDRHRYEVHGLNKEGKPAQDYCCPIMTCRRHKRGFRRQLNMINHQRRIHGSVKSGLVGPGILVEELDGVDIDTESSTSPFPVLETLPATFDLSATDQQSPRDRVQAKVNELQRDIDKLVEEVVRRKDTLAVLFDVLKGM